MRKKEEYMKKRRERSGKIVKGKALFIGKTQILFYLSDKSQILHI
jgi:hypothetical protein